MKLILIEPGGLLGCPVPGDPIPDLVLDHQHAQLFELFAKFTDIETDQAVIGIHVGMMIEDLVRAGYIDFQYGCQVTSTRLINLQETRIEIFQGGQIRWFGVLQVGLIDQLNTAVKHRFFFRFEPTFPASCQLHEGKDEVHLERDRVFFLAVVQVEVEWIDVLAGID